MSNVDVTKGVSPARKKFSAVVLVALLVVLGVEMRAGLGHMLSGKTLAAQAPEGVFQDMPHEQLKASLALFPTETLILDRGDEMEYRYSWFSLLRPLFSRPEAAYYVVVLKAAPFAMRYSLEAPSAEEIIAASRVPSLEESGEILDMGGGFGGGGGDGSGGGDGDSGGGDGDSGGRRRGRRPPADGAGGESADSGRQRPEAESGGDAPATPEEPAKPAADAPATPEEPAKPSADAPATPDEPAKPAADAPATP